MHILPFAYVLLYQLGPVSCHSDSDLKGLKTKLFVTSEYDKLITPKQADQNLLIKIDMSLYSINEVDELGHKLVTSALLDMSWGDHRLAWNESVHNEIHHFY